MPKTNVAAPKPEVAAAAPPEAPAAAAKPVKETGPSAKPSKVEREVIYEKPKAVLCIGENAVTVEQMKDIFGWEEEEPKTDSSPGKKFGNDYTWLMHGRKIRCTNNVNNRPFDQSWAETLGIVLLNRQWRFNFDPFTISKTGNVISGQHRGYALIWAEEERVKDAEEGVGKWKENWPEPVTMETLVGTGAEEDPETIRTVDTAKPRTLSDAIYTNPEIFGNKKGEDRVKLCKMLEVSIKEIWVRTGEKDASVFSKGTRRTHGEFLEFLERHDRLMKSHNPICLAVAHIYGEAAKTDMGKYMSPGYAAGMMFLMGVSNTDGDEYHHRRGDVKKGKEPERCLNFDAWEDAKNFWTNLVATQKDKDFKVIDMARRPGAEGEHEGYIFSKSEGHGSLQERKSHLIRAWNALHEKGKLTHEDVEMEMGVDYKLREDGSLEFVGTHYSVMGIDIGGKKAKEEAQALAEADAEATEADPTPEEIAAKAKEEKEKALAAKREENKKQLLANAAAKNGTAPAAPAKPLTRKQVEAANTAAAKAADEAKAATPPPAPPKKLPAGKAKK